LILGLRVCMDPSLHVPLPVWEWLFNGNTVWLALLKDL
jgi:hypothetical protein